MSYQSKIVVKAVEKMSRPATNAEAREEGDKAVAADLFVFDCEEEEVEVGLEEDDVVVVVLPGSGVPLLCARTISAAVSARP